MSTGSRSRRKGRRASGSSLELQARARAERAADKALYCGRGRYWPNKPKSGPVMRMRYWPSLFESTAQTCHSPGGSCGSSSAGTKCEKRGEE